MPENERGGQADRRGCAPPAATAPCSASTPIPVFSASFPAGRRLSCSDSSAEALVPYPPVLRPRPQPDLFRTARRSFVGLQPPAGILKLPATQYLGQRVFLHAHYPASPALVFEQRVVMIKPFPYQGVAVSPALMCIAPRLVLDDVSLATVHAAQPTLRPLGDRPAPAPDSFSARLSRNQSAGRDSAGPIGPVAYQPSLQ